MHVDHGEERERRAFFSWQSDTPPKANRTIIEDALERACKKLQAAWAPSDRPREARVLTASSDVTGARQIADVIFERIRSADAFVADVSLVVRRGKRLMPNPNVLVETGYALHALTDARIILVANTAHGEVERLPFDLRGRLTLTYSMRREEEPAPARAKLTAALVACLGRILTLPRTTQDVRVDVAAVDIVALDNLQRREPVFMTTVRNFSDYPLRLVSLAYQCESDGFIFQGHRLDVQPPIPARDSRSFPIPLTVIEQKRPHSVIVQDSLGRSFSSEHGAVDAALAKVRKAT